MEQLPVYIKIIFGITTLLTALLFLKATRYSKPVTIVISAWLIVQAIVAISGFYTITNSNPPRFALLLIPPILIIMTLFGSTPGKKFIDRLDVKTLTLLHIVRIPVELCLFWLYLHKAVPSIMTFEGGNFDILSGISAPLIYYYGYVRKTIAKSLLIGWNIVCLILLAKIVVTAVLSAPLPFQQFAFDQPNIALLYFPFIWLPCFVVPVVLFSHLVSLRQLWKTDRR